MHCESQWRELVPQWVVEETYGKVTPIVAALDPPVNGRFCMRKFAKKHLLVLAVAGLTSVNDVLTHAYIYVMMRPSNPHIGHPSGRVTGPRETMRIKA